ncbi:MAG TPA: hypothetical protein VGE77_10335 [Nocardioides sp.]
MAGRVVPASPTLEDPAVARLSEVLGGPGGVHARGRSWTPLLVGCLLAGLLVALGAGLRAGCETDGWSAASPDFGPGCFSSLPAGHVASGGAEGVWPYGDRVGDPAAEPSPGTSAVRYAVNGDHALAGATYLRAALSALVAPDADVLDERGSLPVEDLYRDADVRAEASATILLAGVLVGLAAMLVVLVVARTRPARAWDGVLVAASPLLVVAALVDVRLVGVAMAVGALLCVRRGRALPAGLMLGVAVTMTWSAWLVLAGLLVALAAGALGRGARARVPGADPLTLVLTTALTWLAVSLPAIVTGAGVWRAGWRAALDDALGAGSVQWVGTAVGGGALASYPLVALGVLALWIATVAVLAFRAPLPPRPEQVVLLVVAVGVALLAAGPADVLVVLPFAVLARPRLEPLLAWQAVELVHAATLWFTTGGALMSGSAAVDGPLAALVVLRVVALLALVGWVVRDVAMPSWDPVRAERVS